MEHTPQKNSYAPLITIILYILGISALLNLSHWSGGEFSLQGLLQPIMAGFFLVFSGFKFMNLRGFKDGYAMYDLLAKKIPFYGYIYPFLELGLGIMYLMGYELRTAYIATIILMGFSTLGVITAMAKKQKFTCACLGTVLNVPLSTVTLIEDLLMVVMAGVMLWMG